MLANDTDPDGGPKSIVAKTNSAHGTVAITGGGSGLTYQPSANYCNSPPGTSLDSFTYTLNGGSTATVTMTVTCVEDNPTAVNDAATVSEDSGATAIDVLANDTDVDGGPISITAKTDGANGTVVITGGGSGLTYAPAANFCGSDTFTYTLDGGSSATVSVTVTCVNDAPSFTKGPNQANVANQNADGSARAYTVDPWATAISPGPANESAQTVDFVIDSVTPSNLFTVQPAVSASGVLTFTTNPANSGTATITLHIHDNGGTANGGVDSSATQSFTIQTVNPPPVAVNDSYTATGNVGINVNDTAEGVLQRGTDDTLFGATITNCGSTSAASTAVAAGSCTTASASGGSVVLNTNGTFTYDPAAGFTGTDHFFYKLTNSGGTSVGDVSITVSNMIWFVKNDAAACTTLASNCGRLSKPFSTLAAFQAVNSGAAPNPQNGNTIFLYTGSGAYTGGVTLRDSQILIGQGAGASITTISGITLAPFSNGLPATGGTRPSLTTSAAATNAITLGSGNTARGLDIGNRTGSAIAGTNFGTLTLTEVDITGTGQALNLNTGTANATFGTVSSSSGTNGIALTAVAGTSSATGGTLTGATGDQLLISGGAGSFTYPGAITNTGTNKAVNVTGKTGGTVTLSGQITDTGGTGGGITLTTNSGATINLSGGVSLSTGANAAFTATGGGTVSVTGSANTLTTTTGTALNVASTTIGASGLNFRSISSNGAVNGIKLDTTGSSGGLIVSGNGSAGTGGTIQNSTDSGILATSTKTPSLSWMNISNNGSAVNEGGVRLTNVSGTGGITSSTVTGGFEDNVYIKNDTTTATFTVQGPSCSITNNSSVSGNNGINILAATSANLTATVDGCSFSGNRAVTIGADSADNSTLNVTITNNTITQGSPNHGNQGIQVSDAANGVVTFLVNGNKVGTPDGTTVSPLMNTGINIFNGSAGNAVMAGRVSNNIVFNDPTFPSGSSNGNGIRVFNSNLAQIRAKVLSNTVKNVNTDFGIQAEASGTTAAPTAPHGRLDVDIESNNVDVNSGALDAIRAQARNFNTVCAKIASNTTDSGGTGFFGIFVRQANSAIFDLDGWNGVGTPEAYVATQNPSAATTGSAGTITGVPANSCNFTGVP